MKKVIACLVMSTLIFGLAACDKTGKPNEDVERPNEDVVQEEVPKYKELTDPRGKTLESTATGEGNPQLVNTIYETKDAVIADYIPTELGYAVDPTGMTDSTAGIQEALYDCHNSGGGTVYLPVGNYAISDTIYIPPFVTLRGDWQDPDSENFDGEYGTIISVWMDSDDSESAGAFKMGGSAGAVGLTVYYPLQTLDCVMPYPYTFFTNGTGSNYMLSTINNVTIINGYRGLGTVYGNTHEQFQVKGVRGTFLYKGISLNNSSDVGTVRDVTISNKYWKEASADCMNAVLGSRIDAFTKEYAVGIEITDIEWTQFNDVRIDGCAMGVHTAAGSRIAFAGCMYDMTITNCTQGMLIDDLDDRWGMVLARSYVEGGIANNSDGKIKMTDVKVVGEVTEVKDKSYFIEEEADLTDCGIDYDDTYVKPAARVLIADIPSGLFTDGTPALQKALDEMAAEGGGVVYVPGGTYRFLSPITVPANVELRGSSSVAARDHMGLSVGTVFTCYYGDDPSNGPDDQAFITLAGENAGINGIRIIYPENSSKSEDINTTYTVRGTAAGVSIVNSVIVASSYGVDFRNCDNHYIEGVMTTCYKNAFYLGGKGGNMNRCLQNGTVMQRTNTVPGLVNWVTPEELFTELLDKVLRKECTYIKIEDATDQLIYSVFAYGCKTGFESINSENTLLINIGNDNIGNTAPQIIINGGSLTGINVMRYNGYSYELEAGNAALYNRIAISEAAEKTVIKSK